MLLHTELIREQARGQSPFFTTIALERGLEYTGQVVVPGGKPAAGIPYAFEHGTSRPSRSIPIFTDDYDGQTDDEGRIRSGAASLPTSEHWPELAFRLDDAGNGSWQLRLASLSDQAIAVAITNLTTGAVVTHQWPAGAPFVTHIETLT